VNPLSILATFPHGVAVFDRDMRAVFINPAFCEMFNMSVSPGVSADDLFSKTPEVPRHIKELFTEGKTHINHDFRPDATVARAMALYVYSVDYGEAERGACVICQADEGKRELQSEFEKEDKMAMLSMITAGLAHEIKNPLSGIKGAAQLISKESSAYADLCKLIVNETDRINSLVNELMDVKTPGGQKKKKTNIHKILDDILLLQQPELARRKITVARDFDPSLPPITVFEDRLKQTFINLIKNAVESTGHNAELRVKTRMSLEQTPTINPKGGGGMMMSVEIIDSGKGIDPEILKHLFTPFNTSKKQGTGLGLVISLKIVRDHGGTLVLENNHSGKGAVARVLLPLQ